MILCESIENVTLSMKSEGLDSSIFHRINRFE